MTAPGPHRESRSAVCYKRLEPDSLEASCLQLERTLAQTSTHTSSHLADILIPLNIRGHHWDVLEKCWSHTVAEHLAPLTYVGACSLSFFFFVGSLNLPFKHATGVVSLLELSRCLKDALCGESSAIANRRVCTLVKFAYVDRQSVNERSTSHVTWQGGPVFVVDFDHDTITGEVLYDDAKILAVSTPMPYTSMYDTKPRCLPRSPASRSCPESYSPGPRTIQRRS